MGKEMRFNFIVSLLLTIPLVLYSSLGQKILGVNLPAPLPVSLAFPDGGINLFSLLLASLVVFWPGYTFILDLYSTLKKTIFDRFFFVVLGILIIYFYSFVATIFVEWKMEAFFEIAAISVIFVILGQWMKNYILNLAINHGVKHNILIKNEDALKNASNINTIIIDKFGALTDGEPKITNIAGYNGFSVKEVLRYKANVETGSNHPLAKAILDEAKKREAMPSRPMEKFESFAGLGIKAQVSGKVILAGKEKFLKDNGVDLSVGAEIIKKLVEEGKTLSLLAVDGIFAGLIAAADTIRPTAKRAVSELKSMGIEAMMITGDSEDVAKWVAKELGIEKYHAGVLPSEKAAHVKKLQNEGKFVAMVSDGTLVLAQSDIVLIKSDPMDIVAAIKLSKATVRKMKQNLFWAAIYNVLAIPVVAGVFHNFFGWQLRSEISILFMSSSFITLAVSAVLLKKIEPNLKTVDNVTGDSIK